MSNDLKLISDIFVKELKSLDHSFFYKSDQSILIFQNSEIQNFIDFLLNCKVIIYNVSTNEWDPEVYDIIQGLVAFLVKIESNKHYVLQLIIEKLKVLIDQTSTNSPALLISVKENSTISSFIDDFVILRQLNVFSSHNPKTMLKFLIDHLQVEDTKFTVNICQQNRSFFKQLAHLLPEGITDYNNQVGGHGLIFGEEMKILKFKNVVFKSVQQFPKGRTEILFYEELFSLKKNEDIKNFQKFVPNYLGLFTNPICADHDLFLGLEDVLSNFIHPSIADIKLGQITYEPDALAGKVAVEKAKYFWREEVGFLFTGIRVYKGNEEDDLFLDRFHGLSLDPDMVFFDGILSFLSGNSDPYFIAQMFVEKLKSLLKWFEHQKNYHFYSSSLLLAYDEILPSTKTCNILVKMIDFTHCRASNVEDLNSIFGLKSLISYFERVKKSYE